ncbi:MAG TPA: AMP-binding protein [Candidatus Limnocylindria bacterium]|nr:AMP-binding protein [Candidatus Limnocylindria bacterium]
MATPTSGPFPKRLAIGSSQFDQLRTLLATVHGHNPFYTAKFDAAGVSSRPRHLGQLTEALPFTTKEEIVADQKNNPPYGTNLTFSLDRYTRLCQTSGTTGTPLRWLDTQESWDWMLRNWEQVYAAAGVTRGSRVFFAFSFGPFLGFWTAFEAGARVGALCLSGGAMSSAARLRAIFDHQANALCCTPTYAVRLAEVAAEEKIDLTQSPVKLIIVAGEPGGSIPATRARLEQLWPGARVFDHYGMTEVGPVGYECPMRPGVLHVIETSYLTEIIDPQTGREVAYGETGELVLTTLGRIGSPLLRYRTGDLVKPLDTGMCECGRHELALEGGILGRTDDMIIVRGVNIYPSAVEQIIGSCAAVTEYRVRVRTSEALSEIEVDVETASGADAVSVVQQLESEFDRAFRLRVPVTVVPASTLPRAEGKTKHLVKG